MTGFALPVQADVLAEVNAIRARGCRNLPAAAPLRAHARLDEAARLISRGEGLDAALRKVRYEAAASAMVRVTSREGDAGISRSLASRFCSRVVDPDLRHLGTYRKGDARWLVFGAPFAAPAVRDADAISRRVLALVNQARSRARQCGSERFPAAPPLQLAARLAAAARTHAGDMAKHDFVDHTGTDRSSPGERLQRTGYQRRLVGENVAGGASTPEEVVRGWLASPAHCSNLMEPRFEHMGVGYAVNPRGRFRIYWAQVFADPK